MQKLVARNASKTKKTDDFWESDDEDEYFDEWDKDLKNDKDTKKKEVNDDLFYDPNMDDEDQKRVEDGRKDDNRETVTKRLEAYNKDTLPLLPYYKEKQVLFSIDGLADIDNVTNELMSLIKK